MAPVMEAEDTGGGEETALQLGQQCLKAGDPDGAVGHLREALTQPGGEAVDTHLLLAEALWQQAGAGGTEKALPHYEAAVAIARTSGDSAKEGMVALGHGFALLQLGKTPAARERVARARELAEADGNVDAVRFVERLLEQVTVPPATGPEVIQQTFRQFAETIAVGKAAVVFMRGSLFSPADSDSWWGAELLRKAGCFKLEVVDLLRPGPDVPEGLQGLAESAHIDFPQLFIAGVALEDWLEVPVPELRERLTAAGAELGEPGAGEELQSCHGTATFTEGLEPWEVALVEMVSKDGAGAWEQKAESLARHDFGEQAKELSLDAAMLKAAWERLAPSVRGKLKKQPEMPCGHSCNTCPTKHDCQLHDALEHVKDIEDLVR